MATKSATFQKVRETKNAVLYDELAVNGTVIIGSLYVKKAALTDSATGPFPDPIEVTVTWEE